MTKELAVINPKLPAHLAAILQKKPAAANIGEGVSGTIPVIRVAGTQKQIAVEDGQTTKYNELDVIIVGVNPNISYTVFDGAYNPKAEPVSPVFASDDGTPVPAEHMNNNVNKARRLAVLLADNPSAGLYELRVPFASIMDIDGWVGKVRKSGVPVFGIITHISFSEEHDYPRFAFTSESFVSAEQAEYVDKYVDSPEVATVLRINKPATTQQAVKKETARSATVQEMPKPETAAKKVTTKPAIADDASVEATLKSILG